MRAAASGGIKGYGIAGMVNIVAGVLSGAAYGYDTHCMPKSPDDPANIGYMIQVIDIKAFVDPDDYARRTEDFVELIHNTPRAKGVDSIHYPGDIEAARMKRSEEEGIELSDISMDSLKGAAELVGLEVATLLN